MALDLFFPHQSGPNYWDSRQWLETLFGQHFGLDVAAGGLRNGADGVSQVVNAGDRFAVRLDCRHFAPKEITVKVVDHQLVIHGKHEERTDSHGWIQREFTRRYVLPDGCEPDKVLSSLDGTGILSIEAPKKALPPPDNKERVVPIAIKK
ncbi:unnamed protein product [Oppiella nova]|uniref:SHSP domain-containing protein n=1 Tax=Oppiella nova TaxID=334625 RepID=A0A7R9QM39_9ACAR|nr:unnamed protein product [Oppiella nova]CAG2168307.1 unnamed protein product [Oppiella nova]